MLLILYRQGLLWCLGTPSQGNSLLFARRHLILLMGIEIGSCVWPFARHLQVLTITEILKLVNASKFAKSLPNTLLILQVLYVPYDAPMVHSDTTILQSVWQIAQLDMVISPAVYAWQPVGNLLIPLDFIIWHQDIEYVWQFVLQVTTLKMWRGHARSIALELWEYRLCTMPTIILASAWLTAMTLLQMIAIISASKNAWVLLTLMLITLLIDAWVFALQIQIYMPITMSVCTIAQLSTISLIPTEESARLDVVTFQDRQDTINTEIQGQAVVKKIVLSKPGETTPLIFALLRALLSLLQIILQENAWLNVLKCREYMLICFSMCVLQLVQVVTSVARLIKPVLRYVMMDITEILRLHSVLVYAQWRSTATVRMWPVRVWPAVRDG